MQEVNVEVADISVKKLVVCGSCKAVIFLQCFKLIVSYLIPKYNFISMVCTKLIAN